jgi:hypothetical protein
MKKKIVHLKTALSIRGQKTQDRKKVVRLSTLSEIRRSHYLLVNAIADEIFEIASRRGIDWGTLAGLSGLCYQTVYRLGMRYTKSPHATTLTLLADAIGYTLALTPLRKVEAEVSEKKA